MRHTLFAFFLSTSLVLHTLPAFAQEVPEPTPESVTEEQVMEPALEESPDESLLVPEETVVESTETSSESPVVEMASVETETAAEDVPAESSISLLIRSGEHIAWSGTTTLPTEGTITVRPTGSTDEIEIPADSLLAVLLTLDATTDAFDVTDLDYYPSFDSFIVNCIRAQVFPESCSEWQYVIDGQYPFVGIDKYELENGDEVFFYFGSPRRVTLGDEDIKVNESFTATAESYDPESDTYSPLAGYTIGITQPNPLDPWTPLEIATSTSGADGSASFSLALEGTYSIGLKEDFYFPSKDFAVTAATSTDTGGGSGGDTPSGFSVPDAYAFLTSGQNDDGSWESELVTDWSAFALALSGAPASTKSKLISYLKEEGPDLETVRDYERHALALMALNINPYTGGPDDYLTPIVESFDGTQIDDPDLMNDDVFALIPLLHAGYTKNDSMVQKIVAFIVSEQKSNGSWEQSVDMTAATIQALSPVSSLPGVPAAITKAEDFLHASQEGDGGFGDPFATAWVLQAIYALGQSPNTWKVADDSPLDYLAAKQEEDGGLLTSPDDYSTRAWAIAYAIPAVKGAAWDDILRDFRKPTVSGTSNNDKDEETDGDATTTDKLIAPTLPLEVVETPSLLSETAVAPLDTPKVTKTLPSGEVLGASVEAGSTTEEAPVMPETNTGGFWHWLTNFFHSLWLALVNLFS